MRGTRFGAIIVILLATLIASGPGIAGTASIGIDSVGGRKVINGQVIGTLFGKTLVQGTAIPSSAAPNPTQTKPLVADAGDSSFAATGSTITLLGSGFGGTPPYTFAWTSPTGTLTGADAATAQVATAGVAAGTYTANLTVRDQAGATASDTVKFVLFGTQNTQATTLLDQTKNDATPGVLSFGVPGTVLFPFTVPPNTVRIDVRISWTLPINDYDLRILDPSGAEANHHGDGVPTTEENASVDDPVPGIWNVAADKFTTTTDNVRAQVQALVGPPDPRPSVKSGGPYKFAVGASQAIAGSVTGGTAPVASGWDTDQDGRLDVTGTSFTGGFGQGRFLITLKATDADGLERRETTSVFVADPARLAVDTTAITVVGINDSGLNPYHLEFSAQTYPDPDVLRLTNNFTRHPSEYIPGYPKDAQAIPMTLGKGYFPVDDARGPDATGDGIPDGSIWDLKSPTKPWGLEFRKLYWIPGTKIIGATQPDVLSCSNCAVGNHVILDDDGHGSGSSSVSVGNRYGYCPTCLLVIEKGLDAGPAASYSWIDIQSNSWGTVANAPFLSNTQGVTKPAAERGQTILFAAGNGTANAFESPVVTYWTSTTGPDWNVVVGAIRRDNQRAIIGDGTPSHLSSWGDGNLPSACRTGVVSQCAFGGTSAATPYTAGVFGNVLTAVRRQIGDTSVGQRGGQVIAEGWTIPASPYLSDGKLTRAELRDAVFKTAFPLNQDNAQSIPIYPYPWTAPYNGDINVIFEGYGAATPNSAKRAIDVLLGKMPTPVREAEDRWFAVDRQIRDSIWGGYDRDGDGTTDNAAPLGAFGITGASMATVSDMLGAVATITNAMAAASLPTTQTTGANAYTYWLHRSSEGEPQVNESCGNAVTYMDQDDTAGDWELCFSNRATSVLAAFRPLGIWPTSSDSTVAIPAGSTVSVEMWIASDQVTIARPNGLLMAGDRVLGEGAGTPTPLIGSGPWISQGLPVNPNVVNGAPKIPTGVSIDENKCAELGELCWNKLTWSFTTTRHAIPGEQLTFQVQMIGVRAWAFGYEGQHRSFITITPAPIPGGALDMSATFAEPAANAKLPDQTPFTASGFFRFPDLGTTAAGDHPAQQRVWVSVDDQAFANAIEATLTHTNDGRTGTWSAPVPGLTPGAHTLYARACLDVNCSAADRRSITVEDLKTTPRVQVQIVPAGASPKADGWTAASGLLSWSFAFDTQTYGKGDFDVYARLLEGGVQTAITSVHAKFR